MKRSITIIILIICLSSLSFFIGKNWNKDSSFSMAVQEYLQNKEDFLNKNNQILDIDSENPDMGIMNEDFKSYDIILLGENKDSKINLELEDYFIKYLVRKQDIKNIILEIPYSAAYNINKYIVSGDINYIKSLSDYKLLSSEYKMEFSRNWQQLKNFSDSLPSGKKFKITGFEMNVNPYYTCYTIKNIIKGKKIDSIPNLKNLDGLIKGNKGDKINDQDVKKLYDAAVKVKSEIEKNEAYKNIFKDDYISLRILINELESSSRSIINKYSSSVMEKEQEEFFRDNCYLYGCYNTGKYFAGIQAASVVSNSFKGNIFKIGVLYINTSGENPYLFNDLQPYISEKDKAVAFRTKGKYSPFNYEDVTTFFNKLTLDTAKISDNFNLVILTRKDK